MRSVNISYTGYQYLEVNDTIIMEELTTITEDKINNRITVNIAQSNSQGKILNTQSYTISGEKYDLIMSANPFFAPSKPENEYRESDIWYIIDLIRSENNS